MLKWTKRIIIGVIVWIVIAVFITGIDIWRVNRGGKTNYDALRLGMNIKDVSIPWKGALNIISCRAPQKDSILIELEKWPDYTSGRKALPEECKHMSFFFGGVSFQRITYSVEFDEKWNINQISPMRSGD